MNNSYDKGLEEIDMEVYTCPKCGIKKPVAEQWDKEARIFVPCDRRDTICGDCDTYMDRS